MIDAVRQSLQVPVIKAFSIASQDDVRKAEQSRADYILLDHGAGGTGDCFDWALLGQLNRPYFLAGGSILTMLSRQRRSIPMPSM